MFVRTESKFDFDFRDRKSIINSLSVLNDGGFIVCHDMNPAKDSHQVVPRIKEKGLWNGDCWRAWVRLRRKRNDLDMQVINADHGLGVISMGSQKLISCPKSIPWALFTKHRDYLLNVVSVKGFLSSLR